MRRRFLLAQLIRLMRILFDHGTPSGIARSLSSHDVTETIECGWDRVSNGELLRLAEDAGFDVLLTTDKGIRYQQNLTGRMLAIVVLGNSTGRIVRLYLDRIALVVAGATPGSYSEVDNTIQVRPPYRDKPRLAHFSQRAREMGHPAKSATARATF
jgi:hypothetical protein